MLGFTLGLVIGVALGLVVIAFLALGAYERGYEAATSSRRRVTGDSTAKEALHVLVV